MPRAIGLEITDAVVRIADLEGSGKKLRLNRYVEEEIPRAAGRPWVECAAETITALFSEHKLPRDRVVTALDSGDVFIRFLALPFKNEDQIRKVVKFELENHIPNHAADELIVDYIPAEHGDKGTLLLTTAAPKTSVRSRLALLEKAGVDPVAIDLDANALFNAFARGIDLQSDEPFVLIHGDRRFTKLLFVQRKIPRFVRTLRFALDRTRPERGADESPAKPGRAEGPAPTAPASAAPARIDSGILPALTDQDTLSSEPLLLVRSEAAPLPGDAPGLAPGDRIAILGREVSRFLLSSLSPTAPTCLLLTGEFARHAELAPRLEEVTKLVTDSVDFLTSIEHPYAEGEAPPHIAIPLGLALKGLDIDRTHIDFRKEEFVYQRRFELVRKTLAASILLIFMLLLLPAVHYQFRRSQYAGQLDSVLAQQETVFRDVFPKPAPPPSDREKVVEELKKRRREEEDRLGRGTPLPVTALDHLRSVFEAARNYLTQMTGAGRNNDLFISMDRYDCNLSPQAQWQIEFTGQVASPPHAEGLQNALRNVKEFETVTLDGVNFRQQENKYSYTIRIKIRPPKEE